MDTIALMQNVTKKFPSGDQEILALKDTSIEVHAGELVLIIGPSGSGKTTLLLILGGIEKPDSGDVFLKGNDLMQLNEKQKSELRLENIGFVFQQINLIKPLKVSENVGLPAKLAGKSENEANRLAVTAIERIGLPEKSGSYPEELSGGEQQRIAIARAMVLDPSLMLCDEPTASLDSDSLKVVMQQLEKSAKSGKGVIVVSHDKRLEDYADRIIEVIDGEIKE